MKKITFLLLVILNIHISLWSQEKKDTKPENLEKVADDMKFNNGVQFLKLKNYSKAVLHLHEYLEIYTNGNHRNEAYKYLADIYFGRFDYQKAIDIYKKIYEEYSNSEEGISAYFNIGICYKKMGYDKKALLVFEEIMKTYPGSNYAYLSKMQMDLLKILKNN